MSSTKEVPCNFVGIFKVGDNLVFNCNLLCDLHAANNSMFNKLIVLQIGSILEAALSQIIFRAQNFNREGVPNISEADRLEIEGKKIDKFSAVIDVLRKYKVLNELDERVYDNLHKLRKYRNKIHIEDDIEIQGVARDESEAFTDEIRNWSLRLNVQVIEHLSQKLARPKEIHGYVGALKLPVPE